MEAALTVSPSVITEFQKAVNKKLEVVLSLSVFSRLGSCHSHACFPIVPDDDACNPVGNTGPLTSPVSVITESQKTVNGEQEAVFSLLVSEMTIRLLTRANLLLACP
nr:hypothetical protein BaRGS_008062 [Batillaria attramentaria]